MLEHLPGLGAARLLARQPGLAPAVVDGLHRDLDLVADFKAELAVFVQKLAARDDAFRLESGVDEDVLLVDLHHRAGHDRTGLHLQCGEAFLEQRFEALEGDFLVRGRWHRRRQAVHTFSQFFGHIFLMSVV